MKRSRQWFDCVEIPRQKPFRGSARVPSVPSIPSSQTIENKKVSVFIVVKNSPTVSDFEDVRIDVGALPRGARNLRGSPTVSDFMVETSDTLAPSDNEVISQRPKKLQTPLASGSNVTLEDVLDLNTYEVSVDEIPEDADLIIPGETIFDPSDSSDGVTDVPVRVLDDFSIYDLSTLELVPVAQLLQLKYTSKIGASGLAKAWVDEDGDELEDDGDDFDGEGVQDERVKLSTILEFSVHDISEATGKPDSLETSDPSAHSKIYIRTAYAWYILNIPSTQYHPLFEPFWIMHRTLHILLVTIIRKPRITYKSFIDTLFRIDEDPYMRDDAVACLQMLGKLLDENDIQSDEVKAYITACLPALLDDYDIQVHNVSLLEDYLGIDLDEYRPQSRGKAKQKQNRRRMGILSDKEREILKHRNSTYVTPIVSQMMKNLFSVPLAYAEPPVVEDDENILAEIDDVKAHHSNPSSMKWGPSTSKGVFHSIIMDGVEYKASLLPLIHVGDDVMVTPGDDEDKKRAQVSEADASQSANSYANRLWFCKICYFFERKMNGEKVKMFHGQWFIHGSRTTLQETAHSKSLFLLKSCEDNPVASIFKKCNISFMDSEDAEPVDDGRVDANDFHCGLMYNEKDASFEDLPSDEDRTALLQDAPQPCLGCALQRREEEQNDFKITSDGFLRHGTEYHAGDFIYIVPRGSSSGLLDIAQIEEIKLARSTSSKKLKVSVRSLKRPEVDAQVEASDDFHDERRLIYTADIWDLENPERIDGMCFVRLIHGTSTDEIDKWVSHDDHFYFNQEEDFDGALRDIDIDESDADDDGSFELCRKCLTERERKHDEEQEFLVRNGPIRCLELFSGAGGLGTGLDLSGFVETKYAVEFSPSAAATYAKNHPNATVYCQDSNSLLRQAYEAGKGLPTKPLKSGIDSKVELPPMPKRGEVDMISGGAPTTNTNNAGPPCQSFSRANHTPKADDIRSTLPGNMLGYVEYYDPQYFLLENVTGLLSYRLMSTRSKKGRSLEGGIEAGMVKFIMRTLIALGYVRPSVLPPPPSPNPRAQINTQIPPLSARYQVRIKVLQAGQYGAPQSRRRVIFWGAKRGVTLPAHPVPVYAFERGMNRSTLPTTVLEPVSRSRDPGVVHQCAPLRAVSVKDTVGDLPPFDWINPHKIIPATPKDKHITAKRIKAGIPQYPASYATYAKKPDAAGGAHTHADADALAGLPGFPEGAKYATRPQNRYQMWLRGKGPMDKGKGKGKGKREEIVHGHYTRHFGERLVEAYVHLLEFWIDVGPAETLGEPSTCVLVLFFSQWIRSRSDDDGFSDLPRVLQPRNVQVRKELKITYYGRISEDSHFKCAMTDGKPDSKNSWLLHPTQRRMLSVRELARTQGFPDRYVFVSSDAKNKQKVVQNQIRQIGNAVPVPLALHLGKSLGAVLVKDWVRERARKEREGSVVV
ncbi:hypothetical protein H0H92_000114 [Tricholoma furcatifolium]|nr:hypothetical protein H0H92_000114 [Tricholoma furcatifolium]